MGLTKRYEADITLGARTDTGDRTGSVIESASVPDLEETQVSQVLSSFVGEIEQIPPMYSAKKVNGKKLYELARAGKTVERKPALVTIHAIELLKLSARQIRINVTCGKGTYIRVLAEDIARGLGTVAHVEELTRISVGDYRIEDAISIPEFIENWKSFAA